MKKAIDTLCVKEAASGSKTHSHVAPIHATSAFTYSSIQDSIDVFTGKTKGYVYSRYGNPTISAIEDKLASCESHNLDEEAYAVLTNSGLSAISTLALTLGQSGDAVLTQNQLYGGTTEMMVKLLKKSGIDIIFADLNDKTQVEGLLRTHKNIKLVYLETPTNPTLQVVDIKQLASVCKQYEVPTAIDNTFTTFYLQKPLDLDIDYVIYSATKYLNGHGNSLAGAIICRTEKLRHQIWDTMKLLGTNSNAWDAWLLANGIKTLAIRMDRHCHNAMTLASALEKHERVVKVNYPGLASHEGHNIAASQMSQYGGMLSFEIDGDLQAAISFMDNCEIGSIAATLGNVDTLLLHPATSSHLNVDSVIREKSGITDGLIRVSVGIENTEDLTNGFLATLDSI